MRSWLLLTASVAVLAATIATACGDEEGVGESDAESEDSQSIELVAKDFSFTPGKMQAEAGGRFEVAFSNTGSVPHTFTIDELDVDVEAVVGEEISVPVTPTGAGEYTYYCRFHRAQGMQGRITVAGEAGAEAPPPGGSPTADTDDGYIGY